MRSHVKSGTMNESIILTSLNNHRYKDLSDNWKRHVKRMFKTINDDDYIRANYYEYKDAKPDIEIIVNNRKVLLSIKSGHNPEVHCEQIYSFYDFLRKSGVPERVIKILSFYHFGHSYYNGAKTIYSREEIVKMFPNSIKEANDFFDKHEEIIRELIYRCIIRGRQKKDLIDYFYYGNSSRGFLLSACDIYKLITSEKNSYYQSICFKGLTYAVGSRQADNYRRFAVKIHWPILCRWYYDENFMSRYG